MMKRFLLVCVWLSLAVNAAAQATPSPSPYQVLLDTAGNPISNGCIWTYVAGTSTPIATYTSPTIAPGGENTNPIRTNLAGRFAAWLSPGNSYKYVYESSCTPPLHGPVLFTLDNIAAVPLQTGAVDVVGIAGEGLVANDVVYLSSGGLWRKAFGTVSSQSTTPLIGVALTTMAPADTGNIRIGGLMTGFSGLTPGSAYYVAAGGGLTLTPTANTRLVGFADSSTTGLIITANPPQREWTDVAFSAGNFTANGGGTWVVASGDQVVFRYRVNGNSMTIHLTLDTTTITAPATSVKVAIPGGFVATNKQGQAVVIYDNSTTSTAVGEALVLAGGTTIELRRPAGAAWTAVADGTFVRGVFEIEVN